MVRDSNPKSLHMQHGIAMRIAMDTGGHAVECITSLVESNGLY